MSSRSQARPKAIDGVCIVGCGAVSALGFTAAMTAASVRAHLSRFRESRMVDKAGRQVVMSLVRVCGDSATGLDRLVSLALPAAREAVAPILRPDMPPDTLANAAAVLGTASTRPGADARAGDTLLARLSAELSISRHARKRHTMAFGHASALIGVEQAVSWILSGAEEFVVVGGVDSYYDADTVEWLDGNRRLHSETNPDGFVPGEAAAFCLLTSLTAAARYTLTPMATVLAASSTEEPHPMVSDGICIGEGLTRALRQTLMARDAGDGKADWTLCDMNGESFRGTEWTYAYLRTGSRHADPLEIWHPADCYGDVGAASGAILPALAIAAWQRGYARGDRALVWTASDGAHRSAVLLENPRLR